MWLNDDVRFCFTVFEDNLQSEGAASTTHTFWKTDWPPCTTKHCYFWGKIGANVSPSTSPLFTYHNDGIDPVTPPDILYTWNSITPERILGVGINTWATFNLAGMVSPQATGICGIAVNNDPGQDRNFGVRIKNGVNFPSGAIKKNGATGFICGLDENLEFELKVGMFGVVYIYIMGFSGPNVHFLTTAVDLHPTASMVWQDKDTSPYAPDAKACLWSCGTGTMTAGGWKMRIKGSTDDWWNGGYHTYPCIGVDADGKVQVMVSAFGLVQSTTSLIGYITSNFEQHLNAKDVSPPGAGAWLPVSVEDKVVKPPWVTLQEWESSGANLYGMRKANTFFDDKQQTGGGEWMLVHADPDGEVDLWLPIVGRKFYLHGEFTKDIA